MNRILKVSFQKHPVLQGLEFDFTDRNGRPVDTVIIAGENGVGKSKLIEALYSCVRGNYWGASRMPLGSQACLRLRFGQDDVEVVTDGFSDKDRRICVNGMTGKDTDYWARHARAIFSSPGIANVVTPQTEPKSTWMSTLDSPMLSGLRPGENVAVALNRLLYDLQIEDDYDVAQAYLKAKEAGSDLNQVKLDLRISRFTNAFNRMFEDLTYDRVSIRGKQILFKKRGVEVPIEQLSGGERQIIYRSVFLLRNIRSLQGAFVFIDEPEEGLHPEWQKRILQYYKDIFSDESGVQTSQLFVVTHSPFIIHNEQRENDKIIVLTRKASGEIAVSDRPEYYRAESVEAVRDAFAINEFDRDQPCVYVEGRTDERYLTRALETFGIEAPFRFKWVGHIGKNGQEECSGAANLNKAYQFLVGNNPTGSRKVCLFDCDTSHEECSQNNVHVRIFPIYDNAKQMRKGIENALVLDDVDVTPFQRQTVKEGDYGIDTIVGEFDKMACCDFICNLPSQVRMKVFANLKTVIDSLLDLFAS